MPRLTALPRESIIQTNAAKVIQQLRLKGVFRNLAPIFVILTFNIKWI